jgi:streptogramin lyase
MTNDQAPMTNEVRAMRFLPGLIAVAFVVLFAACGLAQTIESIAGTGKPENSGSEGAALKTNIGEPFGVEIGPDGGLYICEVRNHRIWRLDLASGQSKVVAGSGKVGFAGDGGKATEALLNEPYEVRFDRAGNMLVVEMKNHLVRKVDAKTGLISTVAGSGKPGFGGDGGPATKALMSTPHSIALDDRDNVFIADIANHRIRKVDAKTGTIESIAGNGEKKLPENGQVAKDKPLLGPRALFIQGSDMWIALREGHSVWKLDLKAGTLAHIAGSGKKGFTGDGAAAKAATFDGPKGIALGPEGNVYVMDTENNAVRRIDLKAGLISTVAGSGPEAKGSGGDAGPATKAQMDRPHGICVGPDGAIYIGDTNNHRVRRVK